MLCTVLEACYISPATAGRVDLSSPSSLRGKGRNCFFLRLWHLSRRGWGTVPYFSRDIIPIVHSVFKQHTGHATVVDFDGPSTTFGRRDKWCNVHFCRLRADRQSLRSSLAQSEG